jgi:hypothetical protein
MAEVNRRQFESMWTQSKPVPKDKNCVPEL